MSIQHISDKLCTTEALRKWGVSIKNKAIEMETEVLPAPIMQLSNGQMKLIDGDVLRKLPIQKSFALKKDKWIIAYAQQNYDSAGQLYDQM